MTVTGTRRLSGPRPWRAVTAVLALYALVLQAVLGGAAALPNASPLDVICIQHADGGDGSAPAAPHDPGHHRAGCCTLCHAAAAVEPPPPVASAIVWPPRAVARVSRRLDRAPSARAPPGAIASPRAPPVV